ncbi:MAG: hypothetical protein M3119_09205, partial [Verrucomicrobiota bacterium]|nr:hypothetical protein [Verrucomicrobiota bacterium]
SNAICYGDTCPNRNTSPNRDASPDCDTGTNCHTGTNCNTGTKRDACAIGNPVSNCDTCFDSYDNLIH